MRFLRMRRSPFYKRYPYDGGVRVWRADNRGLVDFELGFFYNSLPKAASTTIQYSLAAIKQRMDPTAVENPHECFPLKPSQLSTEELNKFEGLHKFTFTRNPYSRVLSAYLDKIVSNKTGRREKMQVGADKVPTFGEFLRWLDEGGLHQDMHWAPQTSILLLPLSRFDFIGKLETLDEDFRTVLETIAPSHSTCSAKVRTRAPHATAAKDRMASYYSKELRGIVTRLYSNDFQCLGYDPEADPLEVSRPTVLTGT